MFAECLIDEIVTIFGTILVVCALRLFAYICDKIRYVRRHAYAIRTSDKINIQFHHIMLANLWEEEEKMMKKTA